MDLNYWVRFFDSLLPRSRAWNLVADGPLRKYFEALSVLPNLTRDHLVSVLLELFPEYTSRLMDWSVLFGSTDEFTRAELAAEWAAFGGQDPAYIQSQLQSICPQVYVHECWDKSTSPSTLRNPMPYIESSYVLVNDLFSIEPDYVYQFKDDSRADVCGFGEDDVCFGAYDGYFLQRKRYPCPDIPEQYPAYWYVGGETWPDYADIPDSKFEKLVRKIFKIKPAWSRCVLRVNRYDIIPGYDIQDTVEETLIEIQDTVEETDVEIQDRV